MITPKHVLKKKRKQRLRKAIRKRLNGTPECPRLIIVRSNKYLSAQVYDDLNGKVLASATTQAKDVKSQLKSSKDKSAAKFLGKMIADELKGKKVKSVVFDRNHYIFTGRVKVFAESVRENGIIF